MALSDNALITLPELKRYLGIKDAETGKDDLLIDCINEASDMINDHCNRPLKSADYVHYLNGQGGDTLSLPYYPVTEVTEIKTIAYDGSEDALLSGSDTVSNTVVLDDSSLFLRKGYYFPRGRKNIKVSYSAGYEDIPNDVKKVCKEVAAMIYKESKGGEDKLGVRSESKGVGATVSKTFYQDSEKLLAGLDSYRKLNVARL